MMKEEKLAILLTNLGSPTAASPAAVRDYLAEFLGDPLVVGLPRWLWLPLLKGVILRGRPAKSARNYQKIWLQEGSPLLVYSARQAAALAEQFPPSGPAVYLAMRYPASSLQQAIERIARHGCSRVLLFPQFPQYSHTTTGSVVRKTTSLLHQAGSLQLQTIMDFHDHPAYIAALSASVRDYWRAHGRGDHLLLSFHGLPQKMIDRGDPYQAQCLTTAGLLANDLGLEPGDYTTGFQSRFGAGRWTRPAVSGLLANWGRQGLRRIDVLCPGFTCDCLETLEEIALTEKARFQAAGGGEFHYIPCLNQHPRWIGAMQKIIQDTPQNQ